MIIPNFTGRALWVVAALMVLLSELHPGTISKRVLLYFVMSSLILSGAAQSLGSPAFFAWLGDLVPRRVRPTFLAKRVQVGTWVALIAALAGGWLADHFSSLSAYSIILALAGVAGVIDILFFVAVHEPPRPVEPARKLPPLLQSLMEPLRDRPVRIFLIFGGTFMFSAGLFGPFTWLHSMERLGFSKTMTNLILLVAPLLGVAVSTRFWAEVIKRHGNRPVIRLAAVALALVPLGWLTAHDISEGPMMSWAMLLIMTFSVAAVASGYDLASANLMMSLSPHLPRPTVTALTYIASGMSYAAGTWSGGALAEWLGDKPYEFFDFGITNYHVLFLCALLVRIVNATFIAPLLHEPTATATRDTARDIVPDFALSFGARLVRTFRIQSEDG
jgi:MFS family permease